MAKKAACGLSQNALGLLKGAFCDSQLQVPVQSVEAVLEIQRWVKEQIGVKENAAAPSED
jgi:hypothetical protein